MDNCNESIISFMDLLDLDESVIDEKLEHLMQRISITERQLNNIIILLQYKLLINDSEGTECDNDKELEFAIRIASSLDNYNINRVCRIMNIVLSLNPSSLKSKAEHLMQQLLCDINSGGASSEQSASVIDKLKVLDCILDSLSANNQNITLVFLDMPLSSIIFSNEENVQNHFLTITVPKFVGTVSGYNILDEIWKCIVKKIKEVNTVIITLVCLSDYYLPVTNNQINYFESDVVFKNEFWATVLEGLGRFETRKFSLYLAKKGIDCLLNHQKDMTLKNDGGQVIFEWTIKDNIKLENMWRDYFVLMESLEEKQSNIVLPSLPLFEKLDAMGVGWMRCAFEMGLKHDNISIRKKCLEYRLQHKLITIFDAKCLMNALNDVNLYGESADWSNIKLKLEAFMSHHENIIKTMDIITELNWSPVPLFHLTEVFKNIKIDLSRYTDENKIVKFVHDILKLDCNSWIIKKIIFQNIISFFCNTCNNISWHSFSKILPNLAPRVKYHTEFCILLPELEKIYPRDTRHLLSYVMIDYNNLDFAFLYLSKNLDLRTDYLHILYEKLHKIQCIVSRQYASYAGCIDEFLFIAFLLNKVQNNELYAPLSECTEVVVKEHSQILINYVSKVLMGCDEMSANEVDVLCASSSTVLRCCDGRSEAEVHILALYKMAVITLVSEQSRPQMKSLSLSLLRTITNLDVIKSYQHELLSLDNLLENIKFSNPILKNNDVDEGRMNSIYFENLCKLIYDYLKNRPLGVDMLAELIFVIENVLDCGGYGCLRWIIKIVNLIQHLLLKEDTTRYDLKKYINRCWKEVEELKSNKEFLPCINEFINILMDDGLLKKSLYTNFIISYCIKIIGYGSSNYMPLYHLVCHIERKLITKDCVPLMFVLSEILLFCHVPKKDIRLTDKIIENILTSAPDDFRLDAKIHHCFYYEIRNTAVSALLKVADSDVFKYIQSNIMMKIETLFKNKQRYHADSEPHRMLLAALQHMLLLSLVAPEIDVVESTRWCINMLGKLPHQTSTRLCMEWYISLYFIKENRSIGTEACDKVNLSSIPLISQFFVLYFTLQNKLMNNTASVEEYKYVMEYLLGYTMGQLFNVRLHAQYFALVLFKMQKFNPHISTYDYTMNIIEHTLTENSQDKNLIKMSKDYMVHEFDIIKCLTPNFIYCFLPKYYGIARNEVLKSTYLPTKDDCEQHIRKYAGGQKVARVWLNVTKFGDDCCEWKKYLDDKTTQKEIDITSRDVWTIQKKYIPWSNMYDVVCSGAGQHKAKNDNELIVVASLVDKLPNLGGLARTSEVFGVNTYVVDSLRHLHDKQFRGLSLSAEHWVNIEEVPPGKSLKEYLLRKKDDGYSIVAAEQTSSSVKLNSFKFPKKCLLLLGHEKDGVTCDLLPMMDYCVEIPQKGYIRSLNVHVTAAIFIWEYVRQHTL